MRSVLLSYPFSDVETEAQWWSCTRLCSQWVEIRNLKSRCEQHQAASRESRTESSFCCWHSLACSHITPSLQGKRLQISLCFVFASPFPLCVQSNHPLPLSCKDINTSACRDPPDNPGHSPHLKILNFIPASKILFLDEVTCTGSRDYDLTSLGAIMQPTTTQKATS